MAGGPEPYATREDVKQALDVKLTARSNAQVDRAVIAGAGSLESDLNRVFYPSDATKVFDWPNRYQRAAPWRLYFNQHDLVSATAITSGGVAIPLASVNLEPAISQLNRYKLLMDDGRSRYRRAGH